MNNLLLLCEQYVINKRLAMTAFVWFNLHSEEWTGGSDYSIRLPSVKIITENEQIQSQNNHVYLQNY